MEGDPFEDSQFNSRGLNKLRAAFTRRFHGGPVNRTTPGPARGGRRRRGTEHKSVNTEGEECPHRETGTWLVFALRDWIRLNDLFMFESACTYGKIWKQSKIIGERGRIFIVWLCRKQFNFAEILKVE